MEWIVYQHRCKTTGLSYVGLTKGTIDSRWQGHTKAKSLFGAVVRTLGESNFDHIVLESGIKTQELAFKAEKDWIKKLNTVVPHGYNVSSGSRRTSKLTRIQACLLELELTPEHEMTRNQVALKSAALLLRTIYERQAT